MNILDRWLEQIPESENPQEITKAEILSTSHCWLSAYFSKQCENLHGWALQTLVNHPWPDKTPGPPGFVFSIQAGLEWLFVLLDPLTKFAYLQGVNETYPKSQAPLHKIRKSLLRDQKSGFQVFMRFEKDLEKFWKAHAKPLNPGRDWRENERIAQDAFYRLIQSDPQDLTGKLALGFMAEHMTSFTGDSTLSGQKLSVFADFLRRIGADLQSEHTEAVYKLGTHARQSRIGEYGLHDELKEVLQPFLEEWIDRETRKGRAIKPGGFFTFLHKGDHGGLEGLRTETGKPVVISFKSGKMCYHLENPENVRPPITKDNFRHIAKELIQKRKEPGSFQKR